ncbi:MAG TPA: hypothetical protein PK020_11425 [Ilumatobacteraceae bacterium]|nr:hypothetical protein [Ilumatobacteraceae bacterium]
MTTVRSRVHGGGAAEARVMVKRTAAVADITPRPQLAVVPRQRRTARLIAAGCAVVFGLMLGAAAFQTQLARRQLTLDTQDRDIRTAHETYDVLRRERAELRSPGRLSEEAVKLGMVPATQTKFVQLDADVVADVQRSGADASHDSAASIDEEFQQYANVKAEAGGTP